jgi:putative copper export protein
MQNKAWLFASKHAAEKAMNSRRQPARVVFLFVLGVAAVASLVTASYATGNIVKGDLTGPWVVSLTGNTGCGLVGMEATFTLNSSATGTATLITHGQCGDSTVTGQTFTVITLSTNGHGTANLSCGTGCGWNFDIQVASDRSTFSLVDVSSANPGNYIAGVAVHQ